MKQKRRRLFSRWSVVEKCDTPYNRLEVRAKNGRYVLDAPHVNYSFGTLHEVFSETFKQLNPDYQKIKETLILGFGAGSVARILQSENHCNCQITGVEIDAEVISLARKYFELDQLKNIHLVTADAGSFLAADKNHYDCIVVDIFQDHLIPGRFLGTDFLKNLYNHLNPGGFVLFNYFLFDYESRQKAKTFETDFYKIFENAQSLRFKKHPKNIVFSGSRQKPES